MNTILLQAGGGMDISLLFLPLIFIVFYFFIIRPNQKRQKEQDNFGKEIEKGKKIVTTSGIHGKIVRTTEDTLDIEIAKNTIITIERSAVSKDLTTSRYNSSEES